MKQQLIYAKRLYSVFLMILIFVLLLASAAYVLAAPNAISTIDDFTVNQATLDTSVSNPISSAVTGATSNLIGGEREIKVTQTGGTANVSVEVTATHLYHSQGSGVTGNTLVIWDGVGDTVGEVNPSPGFGAKDFTNNDTSNGFKITVPSDDWAADLKFTVYTDTTHYSEYTLSLPGQVTDGTYYIEYAAFQQGSGASGAADFTKITAMTLLIDGYHNDTDIQIDNISIDTFDWGDLPDSYKTLLASDGPRHVIGSLYLGASIDSHEQDGLPTTDATGDDTDGSDDEDGVARAQSTAAVSPAMWTNGTNGGRVTVTVTGGSGYLVGWFDFNGNGQFDSASGERAIAQTISAGTQAIDFDIPAGTFDGTNSKSIYARFRLFENQPDDLDTSYYGQATNGEVEDYRWNFGPNAVTLSRFKAMGASAPLGGYTAFAAITLVMAVAGMAVGWRRRQ